MILKSSRPVIGITPWYDYDKKTTYIKNGYCEGINNAGGLGFLIPITQEEEILDCIIEKCDGFLISGGPDVDAKYYGEKNLPFNEDISPYRDFLEMYIVKKAVELNKPLLGICRGIQIMNVVMGGTLYQDIYSQIKERDLSKHSQTAPKWYPTHEINIEAGTKLWEIFKKHSMGVNSYHHQAVKDVAPGFIISSRAQDGIIESIELQNHIFAIGVQWHPELMWQKNREHLKLFEEFVNYCSGNMPHNIT
jgi:putative glutamine amidotransferase